MPTFEGDRRSRHVGRLHPKVQVPSLDGATILRGEIYGTVTVPRRMDVNGVRRSCYVIAPSLDR